MNLSDIKLRDVNVKNSLMKINSIHQDGGKYHITMDDVELRVDNDEDGNWFHTDIAVVVKGFESIDNPDDESDPVFEINLLVTLSYEINSEEEMSQDFYEENHWFFDNFITMSAKISIDKLVAHTVLSTIDAPWSARF